MNESFKCWQNNSCVMVDFRKAFDLVDHQILLKKIKVL